MAKKPTTPKAVTAPTTKAPVEIPAPTTTAVRNTAIPKAAPAVAKAATPAAKVITNADIAKRAFEISRSPSAGDETHNWLAAERELRGV